MVLPECPQEAPQYGTRVVDCRNCGRPYSLSNLGRRWAVDETGRVRYTDVHEAACRGWEVLKRKDPRHPFPKSPRDP